MNWRATFLRSLFRQSFRGFESDVNCTHFLCERRLKFEFITSRFEVIGK